MQAAFNLEYEDALTPDMLDVNFQLSRDVADELGKGELVATSITPRRQFIAGIPRPQTASLRDVPGATRSVIPHLLRNNITCLSVGVNPGTLSPVMPNPGELP
jgi:hypothetical protein